MPVEGPQPEAAESSTSLYKSIVKKSASQHRLLSVHWELTYRCNEHCTHCYLDVFKPDASLPDELTTDECLGVIDQIAALGALNLTLSGGDILTRRDWYEIAAYARQKQLVLRLFTNGLLIRPELADKIAGLHPYSVEISLYSARPDVHDAITQVNHSWELSLRAFRLLHERGVRTRMKFLLMHENIREFEAMQQLAQEVGALFSYDMTVTPKNSGARDPLRHSPTFADLVRFMGARISPQSVIRREISPDSHTCGIGEVGLVIDPYGNVSPCVDVRLSAGNLRQQSLREMWEAAEVWSFVKSLQLKNLPVCRTCEIRQLCVRCHGVALLESGDIHAPSLINCIEALARRQVLIQQGTITADEMPIPAHLQQQPQVMEMLAEETAEIPLKT